MAAVMRDGIARSDGDVGETGSDGSRLCRGFEGGHGPPCQPQTLNVACAG